MEKISICNQIDKTIQVLISKINFINEKLSELINYEAIDKSLELIDKIYLKIEELTALKKRI